jgi:hypothetical protein
MHRAAHVTKSRLLSRCVGPRENLTVIRLHVAVFAAIMFFIYLFNPLVVTICHETFSILCVDNVRDM